MKPTKIFVIVLAVIFAALVGCSRSTVQQQPQPDPNAQQMTAQPMANQPDPTDPNNDQYWAQQSYYQWQLQNPNQSFDYFLATVWALQAQRSYYYQNVFGFNTYSPPQRYYHYTRRNYAPIVINRTIINNRTTVVRTPAPSPRWANSPAPNAPSKYSAAPSSNQKQPSKYSSGSSLFSKKSGGQSGGSYSNKSSSNIWKKK
jgi:hypothetical protein